MNTPEFQAAVENKRLYVAQLKTTLGDEYVNTMLKIAPLLAAADLIHAVLDTSSAEVQEPVKEALNVLVANAISYVLSSAGIGKDKTIKIMDDTTRMMEAVQIPDSVTIQ